MDNTPDLYTVQYLERRGGSLIGSPHGPVDYWFRVTEVFQAGSIDMPAYRAIERVKSLINKPGIKHIMIHGLVISQDQYIYADGSIDKSWLRQA